jgi:DNA polymerase
MNRQKKLQRIAEEIKQCRECKKGGIGLPVPGEGSGKMPVLFVGEAPGRTEAKTGRPFIGRSGELLRQMIREIGLDESEVFITSPVHYLPVTGKPSPAMIEHGRTHLLKQIKVIKPRVIVLLGNTACRALLGQNVKIAREHGTVVEKDDIKHFISFHPAYAIRFPDGRKKFIRDFGVLKGLATGFL